MPAIPQYGGVKGEHKATAVGFTLPGGVYEDGDRVRVSFTAGDGTVLSSELIEEITLTDGTASVSYALPQVLTLPAGQLCMRVVLSHLDEEGREVQTFRSGEAVLYFDEAAVENGTPFWTGVSQMLARTVTASKTAVDAEEAAATHAAAAAQSAADGQTYAVQAEGFAGNARDAASQAQASAGSAKESAQTAVASSNAAVTASADAEDHAQTASGFAVAAANAASAARSSAAETAAYMTDALRYKGESTDAALDLLTDQQIGDTYFLPVENAFYMWDGARWVTLASGTGGADGASAYELAVMQGFEGDEAAWLASLKGQDGVGIVSVTESENIYDNERLAVTLNTITLSDGSIYEFAVNHGMPGKDGAPGAKGDKGDKGEQGIQGEKGDPYTLTDTDKAEIVQEVADAIGIPVFGTVDDDNTIVLSGDLPSGTYTLKYLGADDYAEIGKLVIGEAETTYINLVPSAVAPADPTSIFNGVGYMNDARVSSSSPYYTVQSGYVTTGAFPVTLDTVLYIKGVTITIGDTNVRFVFARLIDGQIKANEYTNNAIEAYTTLEELGEQYYKVTFDTEALQEAFPMLEYFFFSAVGSGEDLIVSTTPIE